MFLMKKMSFALNSWAYLSPINCSGVTIANNSRKSFNDVSNNVLNVELLIVVYASVTPVIQIKFSENYKKLFVNNIQD